MRLLGPKILLEDGQINRSAMAEIIFKDPSKRAKVDSLTHPLVWKAVKKEAEEYNRTVGGHRSCYSFKRISVTSATKCGIFIHQEKNVSDA